MKVVVKDFKNAAIADILDILNQDVNDYANMDKFAMADMLISGYEEVLNDTLIVSNQEFENVTLELDSSEKWDLRFALINSLKFESVVVASLVPCTHEELYEGRQCVACGFHYGSTGLKF